MLVSVLRTAASTESIVRMHGVGEEWKNSYPDMARRVEAPMTGVVVILAETHLE